MPPAVDAAGHQPGARWGAAVLGRWQRRSLLHPPAAASAAPLHFGIRLAPCRRLERAGQRPSSAACCGLVLAPAAPKRLLLLGRQTRLPCWGGLLAPPLAPQLPLQAAPPAPRSCGQQPARSRLLAGGVPPACAAVGCQGRQVRHRGWPYPHTTPVKTRQRKLQVADCKGRHLTSLQGHKWCLRPADDV